MPTSLDYHAISGILKAMGLPKVTLPTIKPKKLIKPAVLVVSFVALGVLSGATSGHYQTKQTIQKEQAAAIEQKKAKEVSDLKTQVNSTTTAFNTERVNCQKGATLYANLTPAQRRLIKPENVPACSPQTL
jgi:uncharacterized membrane protein YebE (DUF533 family)